MATSNSIFVVSRKYGRGGSDYLIAFDPEWGTACAARSLALAFPTMAAARAAARKARRVCMGYRQATKSKARARLSFVPEEV